MLVVGGERVPTIKYATDLQVRGAIMRWRGNVTAAADELGIQPKNLRKRLETLGIDLPLLRLESESMGAGPLAPISPSRPVPHLAPPSTPSASRSGTGRQNAGGLSPAAGDPPNLRGVESAAAVDEQAAPIKGVAVRIKPLRLRPASLDRLREAKLDVGARLRVETDENTLLNQFFDEAFDSWLSSKLGTSADVAAANGKGGRGKKDKQ